MNTEKAEKTIEVAAALLAVAVVIACLVLDVCSAFTRKPLIARISQSEAKEAAKALEAGSSYVFKDNSFKIIVDKDVNAK